MYWCFQCDQRTVAWQNDYSFDDCGIEGEGLVHELACANCGARITYEVPEGGDGDEAAARA